MTFRRGFKSQCERRSVEIRKQIGITSTSSLTARILADYIRVTIWSLKDINGLNEDDFKQLTVIDPETWSAFTLRVKSNHLIVFNSSQGLARENSVCMHELSHIILGHQLHEANLSVDGHLIPDNYNKEQEAEADWLAGTLLLPRPVLLDIRAKKLTCIQIQEKYLVSEDMINWRFRMTGVDSQLSNRRYRA